MKKPYCILFLFLHITCVLHAQMQTAHWYFGSYAGLDFSSGSPVVVTDGQISTAEGCTSISDEYGNLLFYTDGRRIYDAAHNTMQNGTGLRGDPSSTSSSIILPKPDDCNLYYIFTIDVQDTEVPSFRPKRGMEYNIVDISLNGGLGAVIEKNIEIPINGIQQGYEKLAAISNADKTGYWVLTHLDGNFYVFAVTHEGVNLTPVVSPTPQIYGGINKGGYIKGSPDGTKLAMAIDYYDPEIQSGSLSLYNFNTTTGVVSDELVLHPPNSNIPHHFYGVEFSSDNSALYTSVSSFVQSGSYFQEIVQYNLNANSILDSKYSLFQRLDSFFRYSALQKALDGKIYHTNYDINSVPSEYIGIIENPDVVYNSITGEAPIYNPEAIYIGENKLRDGLPTFLNHYFRIAITINGLANTGSYTACDVLDFNFCSQGGEIQSIHWDFGDGTTSTEMYPVYSYNTTGSHTITLTLMVDGEEYIRTIEFDISDGPEAYDALLEVNCHHGGNYTFTLSDALAQINPDNRDYTITFHTTEQNARNNVSPLSEYTTDSDAIMYVRVEDTDGCFIIKELILLFSDQPEIQTDTLITICSGTSTELTVNTGSENIINWYASENSTTPIFTGNPFQTPILTENTSYWVEAVSPNGECTSERIEITVKIIIDEAPYFNLKQLYCINEQPEILPTVSDNGITGSWSPSVINTSTTGTRIYTFTSDATDCTSVFQLTLTVEVRAIATPEFANLLTEYFFGETPQSLPLVSDNGIAGSWYPSVIDTHLSGVHSYVFIPDLCGYPFTISIKVIDYPRFFTPNGDGYNDYWNIWGFTREHKAEIFIFDRYGKLLKQLLPPGPGWDGKLKNGRDLPSSDYWFTATYGRDGVRREVKGHFSLKR